MNVVRDYLASGQGARPGYSLTDVRGLVIHWIGAAQSRASVIRKNFERSEFGAHYISDWNDGHIIQCIPESEVAYHVGANSYTDTKREICGGSNPNWYLVGIECCIGDKSIPGDYSATGKYTDLGKPSDVQYATLVEFAADFLIRHGLTSVNLYRHYDITGKPCHIWFVKDEARWYKFKADVRAKMRGEDTLTQAEFDAMMADWQARNGAEKIYHWFADMPDWARESAEKAYRKGIIKADSDSGAVNVYEVNLQTIVWLDRLGLLD